MIFMVKMVVFDLDGTLMNSLTDLAISVNYGLKLNGLEEKPVENYKTYVGNGREMLIRRAMGDAWTDHELFEKVKADYDRHYAVHCNDHTAAYDDCAEMLEKLAKKGVKTGVLSNKPDEFVDKMLKKAFPNHKFTQAWGQKPQYKTKPEPDALLALLDMSGVTPEECFYVGDSDVDVFTANNAGVKMAGVSWGFRGKNELMNAGAPFVADTAEELFDYICKFI